LLDFEFLFPAGRESHSACASNPQSELPDPLLPSLQIMASATTQKISARRVVPFTVHFPRAFDFFKHAPDRLAQLPSFDLAPLIQ
jgi:hypothetical protein